MGLIGTLQRRWYVWSWRWRYWLLDTVHGQRFHIGAFIVSLFVCAVDVAYMLIVALVPPPPGTPQKSIADWIVYLIILIISALISYAMRPKPENAKPQTVESPTTEDGTPVKDYFGTCWVDHEDRFLLAWKLVGRDPIRSKGGK
jgi:hypothetical protein